MMQEDKIRILSSSSCDVGKLGTNDIAIKINFNSPIDDGGNQELRSLVFGFSNQLAINVVEALTNVLNETKLNHIDFGKLRRVDP